MTITAVAPTANDQLVDQDQQIMLDFPTAPVEVRVNAAVVWDSGSGFHAPWGGQYIVHAEGYRLVCTPPAPLTVGAVYQVHAETASEALDYQFRVGMERLTTTGDLAAPRMVKASTFWWSARSHLDDGTGLPPQFDGPGNVYLQVLDPRGAEVLTVPGKHVGLVYDETRAKVIIYFVRHGLIYWMEADPGDTPTTQSQLRNLDTAVRTSLGGASAGELETDVSYPPVKKFLPESASVSLGGSGSSEVAQMAPYDAAPAPGIVSGTLNESTVVLRILRPTKTLESWLLVGYHVVKFWGGVPDVLGFVAMAPGDAYAEFVDYAVTPGASYAVIPEYWMWIAQDNLGNPDYNRHANVTRLEVAGAQTLLDNSSVAEHLQVALGGSGQNELETDVAYPPVKQSVPQTLNCQFSGSGVELVWIDSSFPPIGP